MFKEFKVTEPQINDNLYDIREFGAVSDGKTSNSKAINEAIKKASETGGRVVIPNGIWLTGPIYLKSNVELHLEDNALVLFTKEKDEYPLIVTDYEGIKRIRTVSLINAEGQENIAITGKGTFNGNGHLWRPVKEFKLTQRQWKKLLAQNNNVIESKEGGIWLPTQTIYDGWKKGEIFPDDYESEEEALNNAKPYYDFYRPVMISLKHCTNVLIDGVTIQNSPAWGVHPYFCEHFTMRNVNINNPYCAQNGDGIDVESCNYVHIYDSVFETGDDAICLKSGKNREARKLGKPCENVYIHNCTVGQSHGGFVIGSEMSRGIYNVLVKDCTFIDSDIGVRMKSAIGRGGVVRDIYIENVNMANIKEQSVILTMDYVLNSLGKDEADAIAQDLEDVPEFTEIYFKNCNCVNAGKPVTILPLEDYPTNINNVWFEDCNL